MLCLILKFYSDRTIPMNKLNQSEPNEQLSPRETIIQLSRGFMISQCLFAVTKLGIADLLKEGPKHCDDLAAVTNTHSDSLYRFLQVLAHLDVFSETQPKCFQLTPLSAFLQDDGPESLRNFILLLAEQNYACWENVLYSLRTGKSAFTYTHGMNCFQYHKQHPALAENFDRAMVELSVMRNSAVLAAYDFSSLEKLADVGGGDGSLLVDILQHHPALKGILFEQPAVIERALNVLKKAGVQDRCELVSGNFFESVPVEADAYMLKQVLQNWDDQSAIKVLRNCRQAMLRGGRLLIIERIASPNTCLAGKIQDLNMLVVFSAGRVRTKDEFHKLFEVAGFKLTQIVSTTSEVSVIEGECDTKKRP